MSEKGVHSPRSVKEKRVSFGVSQSTSDQLAKQDVSPSSNVEISAFPHAEIKSILRLNLSSLDSPRSHAKETPRRKKQTKPPEIKSRMPRRVESFKEPTETVKHALMRSMSHREPDESTRRFLSKALTFKPPQLVDIHQPKTIVTPRSSRGLAPEVLASNIDKSKVSICCGQCKRRRRILPASGYCKYCTEYLCAECVLYHRSRLTRSHPVVVFYCHKCKELKILNDRGAGHCVVCKTFYCSTCVVEHCSETGHGILEGKDLRDVVEFIIQR